MTDGFRALQDALDGVVPEGFADQDEDDLHRLAQLVADARRDHARQLRAATEESLRHVPRLARPAVRRIVGM